MPKIYVWDEGDSEWDPHGRNYGYKPKPKWTLIGDTKTEPDKKSSDTKQSTTKPKKEKA